MTSITNKAVAFTRTRSKSRHLVSRQLCACRKSCLTFAILLFTGAIANADDGYRLWLRYDPLPQQAIASYRPRVECIVVPGNSATLDAIRAELDNGLAGLLGTAIPIAREVDRDGAIVVGTPRSSPLVASLKWDRQLDGLGAEGFRIRSLRLGRRSAIVIASSTEVGALHGAFHFLWLLQTLQPI